ncbi:MAG: putative glycoside hydrolase [Anaerolineae bacterium]
MKKFVYLAILAAVLTISGAILLVRSLQAKAIYGLVTDELTGGPVAEAIVSVGTLTTQTDMEGRYRLEGVGGNLLVSVQADGYLPTEGPFAATNLFVTEYPLDIVLRPNMLIGTVRDMETELPLPRTVISWDGGSGKTDLQGRYVLRRVQSGATVTFSSEGYHQLQVVFQDQENLDVELEPYLSIIAVLDSATKEPLPGATVNIGGESYQTDENGVVLLWELAPGTRVVVSAALHEKAEATYQEGHRLEIALHPVTVIAIHDLFTQEPLASATVLVDGTPYLTDDEGLVTLRQLSEGSVVQASAKDHASVELTYQGQNPVPIALRPNTLTGVVRDATTDQPLSGIVIYVGDTIVTTDQEGRYHLTDLAPDPVLRIKASGYRLHEIAVGPVTTLDIALEPFVAKGIYIPFGLLADQARVKTLVELVNHTELNAVVVDVKGDRGMLAYDSQIPLAQAVGAVRTDLMDLKELLRLCRERDIYTIARIVVFKDNPLAHGQPDLAVKRGDESIWLDKEGLGWGNPFRREVWDYNIAIAREIAALGFDELQFDYIRFPSDGDIGAIVYQEENTAATRAAALRGFMSQLYEALRPLAIFTSADVFGLTVWIPNEMGIGQTIEDVAPFVDYLQPMLYPSTFIPGNLGYANPALHPYQVVYRSSVEAARRTDTKIRPWLQHYSLYGVKYGEEEMLAQKQAAIDAGTYGWTFWNAGGVYNPAIFAVEE